MRLWSVHPRYFDRQALIACWREALLAQAVIAGKTRGYLHHPQLQRFRAQSHPADAIAAFLTGIVDEADARGYHFAREKIVRKPLDVPPVPVPSGQLAYEWSHLVAKLEKRSPAVARRWSGVRMPEPHPLFVVTDGPVAGWERVVESARRGTPPG